MSRECARSSAKRGGASVTFRARRPTGTTPPATACNRGDYYRYAHEIVACYASLHSVPRLCAHNPSVVGSSPTRPRQP